MYTLQDIFNISATHLLKQQEKSIYQNGCLYRGPNGLQCAAGPFVKDGCPEGRSFHTVVKSNPEYIVDEFPKDNFEALTLISKLQSIHDHRSVKRWKIALTNLARDSQLKDTALTEYLNET
jgi:hypothetical protein